MDQAYRCFPDGAVAIFDDSIVDVGTSSELLAKYPEVDAFDCKGKVLIPGLINAHTHVPMTLLRGLADDRRLDVWLMGYVMPVEREFVTAEFCRLGTLIACAEMIQGGVTTFADMYYFEDVVAEATAEAGMRAVCSQTVLKFPAPDADSFEDSLTSAREFIQKWLDHPLIVPAVAPHAPYTCTPEILQACTALAKEFDVPLHIHLSETEQEVEEWRDEYDMPVIPWVKKLGLFEAKVIAAHCVHVDEGEIHTLQHYDAGVAHNPSSNLKLASGFAPVVDMMAEGLNIGVGTDGTSSNNDLDMFEEVRLASFIAKGHTGDPTAMPARESFAMATRSGAKALHIDHITGSIEIGKRADLALIDLSRVHNMPHFNHDDQAVYSRLVYAAKASDVSDVMVNGRWLMLDHVLQTIDVVPLLQQASAYANQVDAFLVEREDSVLSKLIAIGGAEQEESYEVQIKLKIEDPEPVIERLNQGELEILRTAHYLEYDSYFIFEDQEQGRLRYREDEFVNENGEVFNVRYRLTLTGPAAEHEYKNSVFLSRSRFIAPATHSLRFYREYFKPADEIRVHKDRLRWLVCLDGKEFFVNIDKVFEPPLADHYVEIKSRTWSRRDAEQKANLILEFSDFLGTADVSPVAMEYPDLVGS
jgi:5-methylthioadenosine/S-adenosylhomocysteine deaminase